MGARIGGGSSRGRAAACPAWWCYSRGRRGFTSLAWSSLQLELGGVRAALRPRLYELEAVLLCCCAATAAVADSDTGRRPRLLPLLQRYRKTRNPRQTTKTHCSVPFNCIKNRRIANSTRDHRTERRYHCPRHLTDASACRPHTLKRLHRQTPPTCAAPCCHCAHSP